MQTSNPSPIGFSDLVFVNPAAGGGLAGRILSALQAFTTRTAWQAEFHMTSSAADLASQAQAAVSAGHTRLFVLGGDGSFQNLVNATAEFPEVVLGILPAGGGNDLADALGLPHDPIEAAKLLREGDVCLMDAVRAETADGQVRLYLGGGGVGLDAEASYIAATRFHNLRGRFRYLLSAALAYLQSYPISVRVNYSVNQDSKLSLIECSVLFAAVLNTPSYGSGLRCAPEARIGDGQVDLVLVEPLSAYELLRVLPLLILRGEVDSPRVKRLRVRQIKIETGAPQRFHGDGEIMGYTPVQIQVVPGAIRILCPKGSPLSNQ